MDIFIKANQVLTKCESVCQADIFVIRGTAEFLSLRGGAYLMRRPKPLWLSHLVTALGLLVDMTDVSCENAFFPVARWFSDHTALLATPLLSITNGHLFVCWRWLWEPWRAAGILFLCRPATTKSLSWRETETSSASPPALRGWPPAVSVSHVCDHHRRWHHGVTSPSPSFPVSELSVRLFSPLTTPTILQPTGSVETAQPIRTMAIIVEGGPAEEPGGGGPPCEEAEEQEELQVGSEPPSIHFLWFTTGQLGLQTTI